MRTYIRDKSKGGCYFFTINLYDRKSQLLIKYIDQFRQAYKKTKQRQPFQLDAMVLLPDHIHMMITLPNDTDNYSSIIASLKGNFSRQIPQQANEYISISRQNKRERGIWQRRFWEHKIRNDLDYQRHIDYIHYNPVKHGYVSIPSQWQYSTIHDYIRNGVYPFDWGSDNNFDMIEVKYDD